MILADSSIWIDHFRMPNAILKRLVADGELCIHPFVIAELALGSIPDRESFLKNVRSLPSEYSLESFDLVDFVSAHNLQSTGIGFVDATLLAVALHRKLQIWTGDKRLLIQAQRLNLAATL